ncbi:MAG: LacI family DNA-binding transcriptional regulator [Rhodobiaceae bacterium]|nr:LacI family DNA-binding transcriptional regulator [Rhodobiaceae bacterium]
MRVTLQDVAREAGVSVATVDRVLNRRPGVRPKTIEKVEQAIATLSYSPDSLSARISGRRLHRFAFVLPAGDNLFFHLLRSRVLETAGLPQYPVGDVKVVETDVFSATALAATLSDLRGMVDGVAVVALDNAIVREAIDELVASGTQVVTLVSDVPQSRRAHYVGPENVAAGRTAASLLGRFIGTRGGKIGLIAGSLHLRDHVERQAGFEQVISSDFPELAVLPVREARDDMARVEEVTRALIAEAPDLAGIYNVGAGNEGVIRALEATGRARDIVCIGHELLDHNRRALLSGTLDAVISQDIGHEARSALRVLRAHCDGMPIIAGQERIRIDIFVKENLP